MADKNGKKHVDTPGLGQIEVRLVRPGSRYAYNVYDEFNNLILEAHAPVSEAILRHLKANNVEHLYYDPSKITSGVNDTTDSGLIKAKSVVSREIQNEVFSHTKNLLDNIRDLYTYSPGATISKTIIDQSRSLVDKILVESENNKDGIFDTVTMFKTLDDYYYQHSTNVSILSAILATRLDFKQQLRSSMGLGTLFHDIGFSSVSKEILEKAILSDDEFDIVKGHTHVGFKFVEKNPLLTDLEKKILLLHHERADGEGYPYGFGLDHYQEKVPREVRLASIVDVFVSLTLVKPGERPFSNREALRKMLNMVYAPYKKKYFFLLPDFRDFTRALGFVINSGDFFMGPGDLVRLSTGEVGIIEEMNRLYPMNPKIIILKNEQLQTLKRPVRVDMIKVYQNYVANVYDKKSAANRNGSENISIT